MRSKINNLIVFITLLILGGLTYLPALHASFLLYDDPEYITENAFLANFSFTGIVNLFTQKVYDLYIPLTWLSYWIEINVFKFSAVGMHLSNVLLHILNAFLVFKLFVKLFHKTTPALLIAVLFLVHPQHIESVAWLAERKDVLYTLFYLLGLIFYISFKTTKNNNYYFLAFLLFICSCLAKPMAVSCCVVLILINYFIYNEKTIKEHLNKIPFVVISILFSIIAIKFMNINSSQSEMNNYSLLSKIILPFYELRFYIIKLILPINLCAIYQMPDTAMGLEVYFYAALFISLAIFTFLKGNNLLKLALLLYVIILLPVLQIIPNTNTLVADRYTYVSSIIPFAVICFWADKNAFFQKNLKIIAGIIILILSTTSYNRCKIWNNDESLFTDVISKNEKSYTAYANLGMYYLKQNNSTKALVNLQQAAALKPTSSLILTNYGWALALNQQTNLSLNILLKSLEIDPLYFKTWNNLGVVLGIKGKYQSALKSLLFAQKLNPNNAELYYNLAITYTNLSKNNLAISSYQQAAKMGLTQAQQFLSANNLGW
ncbi:MAG: tetratricopeptide repeat protein [Bacteroidia bacterium]